MPTTVLAVSPASTRDRMQAALQRIFEAIHAANVRTGASEPFGL